MFASHRILTVTADYQLEVDSLLSANPYQSNLWNNRVFSFAGINRKWAGAKQAGYTTLLNGLDINGDLVTVNERQAYVRKDSSYYYLDENTAGIHFFSEIAGHALKIQFMVGDVFICVDRQNRIYAYKEGSLQTKITGSSRLRSREVGEAFRTLDDAKIVRLIYPTTDLHPPLKADLKKAPRLQFLDTGLVNYSLGIQAEMLAMDDLNSAYKGAIIPHLVTQELISLQSISAQAPNFWV